MKDNNKGTRAPVESARSVHRRDGADGVGSLRAALYLLVRSQ